MKLSSISKTNLESIITHASENRNWYDVITLTGIRKNLTDEYNNFILTEKECCIVKFYKIDAIIIAN